MRGNVGRALEAFGRAARLKCPACGRASVFEGPFRRRHVCPACGATFEREEGYFVGAVSINLVATELVILSVYLGTLLTVGYDERLILFVLLPLALLFPVAFYHFSWSAWLAFDNFFEALPRHKPRRRDPPC
ncbi:MAG TPA: DUF983 domain-containing protein [Pyrinomonadaceae bacterium]|nr:DUF983 domain-containing protein [Pyrinomonadaceae bacterium]